MRRLFVLIGLLSLGASPELRHVTVRGVKLTFCAPERFLIGRFKPEMFFETQAVLIEREQLARKQTLDAIEVGEIPIISIDIMDQKGLDFLARSIPKFEQYHTKFGGREIWKLPGYPGPYGDEAFYYLVRLRPGVFVEIFGHRHYFDNLSTTSEQQGDTHYDMVIEGLIATLK